MLINKNQTINWSIISIATATFIINYLLNPYRPKENYIGFYGWSDQKQYLKQALNIAKGKPFEDYFYGILYPALGSISIKMGAKKDPFLVPNLVIFNLTSLLIYYISSLFSSKVAYRLVIVFSFIFNFTLLHLYTIPWTTSLTTLFILLNVYISLRGEKLNEKQQSCPLLLMALFTALSFYTRFYPEAIISLIPSIIYFFLIFSRNKRRPLLIVKNIIFYGFTLLAFTAPILVIHARIFKNPFRTPYYFAKRNGVPYQSFKIFKFKKILPSLGEVLLGINYQSYTYKPVIYESPEFIVSLISLFAFAIKKRNKKDLMLFASLVLIIISNFLIYGAFPAFNGFHIKYWAIHYLKPGLIGLLLINIFLLA